jgi:hypothetical protein
MKDYYEQCTPQMVLERRQQYTVGFYSKATHANIWHQLIVRVSKTAGRAGSYPDLQTRSAQCTCRALFDESAFIIQRLRKVPQPVWAKARIAERNLKEIRCSLAGTTIAEIVPEVRVLFFKARLIEQVRVPFEGGWFSF